MSPQNYIIPRVFSLTEPCFNNVAEYNALIIKMQLMEEIGVKFSNRTIICISSSTKFEESTKYNIKT